MKMNTVVTVTIVDAAGNTGSASNIVTDSKPAKATIDKTREDAKENYEYEGNFSSPLRYIEHIVSYPELKPNSVKIYATLPEEDDHTEVIATVR